MPGIADGLRRVVARRAIGIQSKLLVMLLTVSVLSVLVAGAVGYVSGTNSLRKAEYQRLTQLRESRGREIAAYYKSVTDGASIVTHGATTINAAREFSAGFAELQTAPVPAGADAALASYYSTVFGPELTKHTGQPVDVSLFKPTSTAAVILQSLYTVPPHGDFEAAARVGSAGDPSRWSAANARYQSYFADLSTRFGFEDALILDTGGNIVYTAYKGVDLGSNVLSGPFQHSLLADGYRRAMQATSVDQTFTTDFENYPPAYGVPTPWVLSPIGSDGAIVGVLALQLSRDGINSVMTGNRGWVADGLGQTGETFLVGSDRLMRSASRELLTDPERYEQMVIANGTSDEVARRQVESGDSVLLQPVTNAAVSDAQSGQSGVVEQTNYLGRESLIAYGPVHLPGLDWVLSAEIDQSEALAPVDAFARNIALSTAAIVLVVCLLALLFSRVLTRPVIALASAVRRVSGGELGVHVPVTTRDEYGDLAMAFNDMSGSLRTKQDLLDEQRRQNDELLRTLMPEPLARRFREGEENISSDYRDVTVIYAQLLGFDDFAGTMSTDESARMLNSLVESFEDAADRNGVEQVRNLQDNGLLATCGLVVPRVDHAIRTVTFAVELTEILDRFNRQHDARLALRAGIDSGQLSSGVVGQRSKVYALWGEAVDLAHRVQSANRSPGIFVSTRVRDAVGSAYSFTDAGSFSGDGADRSVWSLNLASGHQA